MKSFRIESIRRPLMDEPWLDNLYSSAASWPNLDLSKRGSLGIEVLAGYEKNQIPLLDDEQTEALVARLELIRDADAPTTTWETVGPTIRKPLIALVNVATTQDFLTDRYNVVQAFSEVIGLRLGHHAMQARFKVGKIHHPDFNGDFMHGFRNTVLPPAVKVGPLACTASVGSYSFELLDG